MSAARTFTDARVAAIGRAVLADARAQMFANVAGCASFALFANERAWAAEAAARENEEEAMQDVKSGATGGAARPGGVPRSLFFPNVRQCPQCGRYYGPAGLTFSECRERIVCLACGDAERNATRRAEPNANDAASLVWDESGAMFEGDEADEEATRPCPPFLASVIGVVFVAALLGLAGVFAAGWLLWRGAGR